MKERNLANGLVRGASVALVGLVLANLFGWFAAFPPGGTPPWVQILAAVVFWTSPVAGAIWIALTAVRWLGGRGDRHRGLALLALAGSATLSVAVVLDYFGWGPDPALFGVGLLWLLPALAAAFCIGLGVLVGRSGPAGA